MSLGLPTESRSDVATCEGHDVCLDVEVTSNRGDCLSHVGLARELCAHQDLRECALRLPEADLSSVTSDEALTEDVLTLTNTIPAQCPLFLACVIRGVRVGESPAWLRARLEAVGQRPINNVVDVTNFLAYELGNPCHVFDHAKLAGRALVIRTAHAKETLTTLDGKARALKGFEVVVADAQRAQGLAGVMGGQASEVTSKTTDVVLEVATWEPVSVRKAARWHQLRTTASHRYERIVAAATLAFAMRRAATLIAGI
jgi:phenylalanyl-tRNA synthetase beta chain